MIPIIRKQQEDELLYSWLHRLADVNGLSMPVFSEAYLGIDEKASRIGVLNPDIRDEFVMFAKNLGSTKTLMELYMDTSIYGFESMWMTKGQQARYINNVFQTKDKLNTTVNTLIKKIRICKECYEEDLKQGMPYLRRKHQISGVNTCYKHKCRLLEFTGKNGHECEFNISDYKEIELDKNIESLIAYTGYVTKLFDAYICTDIKVVKAALFDKLKECGYSVKNQYESLKNDLAKWKYRELLPENIESFLKVKLITADYVTATEVAPFLMYLYPEVEELCERIKTCDMILMDKDCLICGLEYCSTPYAEAIGFGCPNCDTKISIQERFRNCVSKIDSNYVFQDEFDSMDKKITVYHKTCERFFYVKPRSFLYEGVRCKCESEINSWDAEIAISKHKGFSLIEFNGSSNPVTIYSEGCGHTFSCNYFKFLKFPGCRVCKPKHMTAEIFAERIDKLVGDEYRIIEGFVGQRTQIVLEHQICGSKQAFKPSAFLDGQRCRLCTKLEASWNEPFELLCEYQKEFGHTDIKKRGEYKGFALGTWCQRMRNLYLKGKLSEHQIKKLEAIEFDWDPLETEWNRRYEQYKRYIKENDGNPYIPRRRDFEGEHLGAWVETQRKWFTQGKMSKERESKMRNVDPINYV